MKEFPIHLYKEIVSHLQEGIVVMDTNRKIHYINESAKLSTGWKVNDFVPYCRYCQQREVENEQNRCILTVEDPVPFFHSHMAVYSGIEEPFQMSVKKILIQEKEYFVLQLKTTIENENHEQAKFHQLLVQETMLAQEIERKKLARELHDHIGQSVYSIFLGLESIRYQNNNNQLDSHITNMIQVMEKTLNEIKTITKNLRPEIVTNLGLKDALKEAIWDWMDLYKVKINLDIHLNNEELFCKEKELHLFRIIQEGVNNAVRHGKATNIYIQLRSNHQYVFFLIENNGKNFEYNPTYNNGLGLKHMYERCTMLNGDIKWISFEGEPTKVEGFVSIQKKEDDNENPYC